MLAASGYVRARIVGVDAYPSLGASGCVLLEAHARPSAGGGAWTPRAEAR